MTIFKRVCAWCKASLGADTVTKDGKSKTEVTHGICKKCRDKIS